MKLYFILVTSISYLAGQVSIVAARYGSVIIAVLTVTAIQGRSQTFSFGGSLEGPVLQQGELSMICVGLSERDLQKEN